MTLHPGSGGVTRIVSVKTSNGVSKRAVTKICLLPIYTDNIGLPDFVFTYICLCEVGFKNSPLRDYIFICISAKAGSMVYRRRLL